MYQERTPSYEASNALGTYIEPHKNKQSLPGSRRMNKPTGEKKNSKMVV